LPVPWVKDLSNIKAVHYGNNNNNNNNMSIMNLILLLHDTSTESFFVDKLKSLTTTVSSLIDI